MSALLKQAAVSVSRSDNAAWAEPARETFYIREALRALIRFCNGEEPRVIEVQDDGSLTWADVDEVKIVRERNEFLEGQVAGLEDQSSVVESLSRLADARLRALNRVVEAGMARESRMTLLEQRLDVLARRYVFDSLGCHCVYCTIARSWLEERGLDGEETS